MNELISVIVPVFKIEQYLKRCVDSILNQSYVNIEVILVNDGSPDNCGDICDELANQDIRIKVIHKKNGGLSDARNTGIEAAEGKYLTFIDGDDWIHLNYLEKLHALLLSYNADISVSNFLRTNSDNVPKEEEEKQVFEYVSTEALDQFFYGYGVQMVTSTGKLFKKELFKDIRFPLGKIHEDEFTTYKVFYQAQKIVFTTERLLYYWQREDSIMGAGFKIDHHEHLIEALEERIVFYEKINEIDLRDKTYRVLFSYYKAVNENIHLFDSIEHKELFLKKFTEHIRKLNRTSQSIFFRTYYKLYYMFPNLTNKFYQMYIAVTKKA